MATILPLDSRRGAAQAPASRENVRLALTARGRRLVVLAAFVLGLLVAAVSMLALDVSSALAGGEPTDRTVVTVQEGDTLWGYAQQYAPEEDPQAFVTAVREMNHLPTGRVTAGDRLTVPTGDLDR